MKYKICCLIPVKKKSKRLKNKNFLKFGKTSLFENTLNKAIKSKIFDKIIVSSNETEVPKKYSKKFILIKRPEKLSKDPATITDVMMHAINYLDLIKKKNDFMVVLSVTNPFFNEIDIKNCIKIFKKNKSESLLSISEFSTPPFNAWLKKGNYILPVFKNSKYKFKKSTECPKTYFSNGALRMVNIKKFLKIKNFHKLKQSYYETKNHKSIDIDTKYEYKIADIVNKYGSKKFS